MHKLEFPEPMPALNYVTCVGLLFFSLVSMDETSSSFMSCKSGDADQINENYSGVSSWNLLSKGRENNAVSSIFYQSSVYN